MLNQNIIEEFKFTGLLKSVIGREGLTQNETVYMYYSSGRGKTERFAMTSSSILLKKGELEGSLDSTLEVLTIPYKSILFWKFTHDVRSFDVLLGTSMGYIRIEGFNGFSSKSMDEVLRAKCLGV